jgi:hypothetical protein
MKDKICSIINEFIDNSTSFTALDVSNKVKETFPTARHREVSSVVRDVYTSGMMGNYERTAIGVKLADGSDATANLYHPIQDTWELDTKYDDSKRAQTAKKYNPCTSAEKSEPNIKGTTFPTLKTMVENHRAQDHQNDTALPDNKHAGSTLRPIFEELGREKKPDLLTTKKIEKIEEKFSLPPSIWDGMFKKVKKKILGL